MNVRIEVRTDRTSEATAKYAVHQRCHGARAESAQITITAHTNKRAQHNGCIQYKRLIVTYSVPSSATEANASRARTALISWSATADMARIYWALLWLAVSCIVPHCWNAHEDSLTWV